MKAFLSIYKASYVFAFRQSSSCFMACSIVIILYWKCKSINIGPSEKSVSFFYLILITFSYHNAKKALPNERVRNIILQGLSKLSKSAEIVKSLIILFKLHFSLKRKINCFFVRPLKLCFLFMVFGTSFLNSLDWCTGAYYFSNN